MENEIENLMLAIKNNELLMEYIKADFNDKQLEVLALTSNSKYTNGSIKVKVGTVVPVEFEKHPHWHIHSTWKLYPLMYHSVIYIPFGARHLSGLIRHLSGKNESFERIYREKTELL